MIEYIDVHYTGSTVATITKISIDHLNPSIYYLGGSVKLQTTLGIFCSLLVTSITTTLILYRIITVTRHTNPPRRDKNIYKEITDMIIQSSVLYSVVLIIWAISWTMTPAMPLIGSLHQIPINYVSRFIEEIYFTVGVCHIKSNIFNNLNAELCFRE